MSLIDEALKRAQAAQSEKARPEADKRPWTPAPLPDQNRIRRRKTVRAAVFAGALLLAGLGAFLFLRPAPGPAIVPASREKRQAVAPTLLPNIEVPDPRPTRAPRRSATPAARAGSAAPAAAPQAAPGPPDRPISLVNGGTYVGSVMLPGGAGIELGGIVYSESNATALVNGKILGAGAFVEGFVIQRIEENRIELSNTAGLTIFLSLK
jgi:hypothetical protein